MIIPLAFLVICLVIASWWLRKNFTYWNQYANCVASVRGRIFSLNFLDLIKFKTNFNYNLKTIYDDLKFANEPMVGIYGLYKPSLLLKDPEIIKRVLIKDFSCFCERFSEADPHTDPIGGHFMPFLRYSKWKDVRSKLTPAFSSGKLKFMFPLIQQVAENIENYLNGHETVIQRDMKEFCGRYMTDVTATTMFGFSSNCLQNQEDEVYTQVRKITMWNWKRTFNTIVILFIPKLTSILRTKFFFKETETFLSYTYDRIMAERERTGVTRNDLIDIFVRLKQEAIRNGDDINKLREILIGQLGTFMGAGHETSSTSMSSALLELAKSPEILSKLREDICKALVIENGEISYEQLNSMEYMDMIIYETLRLYPVLPVLERKYSDPTGRRKPYSLRPYSDFNIPDGMPLYISTYSLNSDPQFWANPTRFDPERFSAVNKLSRHPMISLPFGNGPRNCIAGRLGILQIKTGLVHLLKNHYVRVCHATVLQPKFEAKSFILQVKDGINLEIVRDNMWDIARKELNM